LDIAQEFLYFRGRKHAMNINDYENIALENSVDLESANSASEVINTLHKFYFEQ